MPHSNGFANLQRHNVDERPSAGLKAASEPATARPMPTTLDPWCKSNLRAKPRVSDPDRPTDLLIAAALAVAVIVLAKWFAA